MVGEGVLTRNVEIGDTKDSIYGKKPVDLINHRKIPNVSDNDRRQYEGIIESE